MTPQFNISKAKLHINVLSQIGNETFAYTPQDEIKTQQK